MFCKKCGSQINEGNAFCTNCGMPIEQESNASVNSTENVSPEMNFTQEVPQKVKKKISKGAKTGIISLSAVVAVLIVSIVTMVFVPSFAAIIGKAVPGVSNFVMKTFASADNYMEYVVKTNLNTGKVTAPIVDLAGGLKNNDVSKAQGQGKIKAVFGEGLKTLISETNGAETRAAIDWISDAAITYDLAVDGNKYGFDLGLDINDTNIINSDVYFDMDANDIYITIPEINSKAMRIDLAENFDTEQVAAVSEFINLIPDEKVLERIIDRYVECIFDELEATDKKSDKITAGGITEKTTRLTVKVSEKTLMDIGEAVLEEAKKDKDIEKIIKNVSSSEFVGENPDEVYAEFISGIDNILSEIDGEDDAPLNPAVNIYFWINNKAEIVGIGTGIEGMAEFKYINTEDGDKYGLLLLVGSETDSIKFEGNGIEADGKKSGSFDLYVANAKIVNVITDNVDIDNGKFEGKIAIQVSDEIGGLLSMIGEDELEEMLSGMMLEFVGSEDSFNASFYMANELFAGLEFTAIGENGTANTEAPSDYIDCGSPESEEFGMNMAEWGGGAIHDQLIDNFESAGLPSEMIYASQTPAYVPEQEISEEIVEPTIGF